MRLLLVNVFYWPQSVGGATRVVEDNAADFAASREVSSVCVFSTINTATKSAEIRAYNRDGVRVFAAALPEGAREDFLLENKFAKECFGKIIDFAQPDLIHFHCIQRMTTDVVFAAAERRIPYVVTMHDGWWISDKQFLLDDSGEMRFYDFKDRDATEKKFGPDGAARAQINAQALAGAAGVFTVSRKFRSIIEMAGLSGVEVTENGVSDLPVLPKSPDGPTTVGYLGGIAYYKGYHNLRLAVERRAYSNLRFVIVDHSMPAGRSVFERWGESEVERIGLTPQARVQELYARLHVVAVPSIWPESYGLVAREALQSGAWLIASTRGAASEEVREGVNGFTFDPEAPGEIENVLDRISLDPVKFRTPPPKTTLPSAHDQAQSLIERYRRILKSI